MKEKIDEFIEMYPTEDDYISANIKHFMDRNNDPDDNSIELAKEYQDILKQNNEK